MSCDPAGSCAAGGYYWDRHRNLQGFVVSERNGTWGRAIEVPGLAALSTEGYAEVLSVWCGPAGSCAAGGDYYDRQGQQGFVVSEQNGTWGRAIEVPGLAALNMGFAEVLSVSCGSAGSCVAGGYYYDHHDHQQGFVDSEQNGTWGRAVEVPGLAALNAGGRAATMSVSCGPAGSCVAGGYYADRHGHGQGFVVSEQNGTWGGAVEVPGLAALNAGGQAATTSVSCDSAGSCAAAGYYQDRRPHGWGFVVSEQNGTWGGAIEVPGLGSLTTGGAKVYSLSCTSAGNCAADGSYPDRHGHGQVFVVSELNGTWGSAIEVPGLRSLNAGGQAGTMSVSCGSAGNCAAGGSYLDRQSDRQGFVVSELNGTWGRAIEVPGLGSLNAGVAHVSSVSCSSAGSCAAGGYYQDGRGNLQGFVVSQS